MEDKKEEPKKELTADEVRANKAKVQAIDPVFNGYVKRQDAAVGRGGGAADSASRLRETYAEILATSTERQKVIAQLVIMESLSKRLQKKNDFNGKTLKDVLSYAVLEDGGYLNNQALEQMDEAVKRFRGGPEQEKKVAQTLYDELDEKVGNYKAAKELRIYAMEIAAADETKAPAMNILLAKCEKTIAESEPFIGQWREEIKWLTTDGKALKLDGSNLNPDGMKEILARRMQAVQTDLGQLLGEGRAEALIKEIKNPPAQPKAPIPMKDMEGKNGLLTPGTQRFETGAEVAILRA